MNIGILLNLNFTKQKRAVKLRISVCSRIIRLMNNQTKSQRKGTLHRKRRESDDNAVAIVKIVPQLGCVSQDSDALVSQRRKQPRGNPMPQVLGSIRRVRFTQSTLRQASIWEKKGPSLRKIQVKPQQQRSPSAVKFEDGSHEETERQERCAQSSSWNLAKKHLQAQRERQNYILLARGKSGYSRLRQQKSRTKESLWKIPEPLCTWSASETLTLLCWRP